VAATPAPTAIVAASADVVVLDPDGRRLRGLSGSGSEVWVRDVIAECGVPAVGEPRIRHLASGSDEVHVVYGKHSFASVLITDGTVTCRGADKAVDPLAGIDPKALILLGKLNSWDGEECDIHERPEAYPDRVASGESNGWIDTHKEGLAKLGYEVAWDAKVRRYLFAPGR